MAEIKVLSRTWNRVPAWALTVVGRKLGRPEADTDLRLSSVLLQNHTI